MGEPEAADARVPRGTPKPAAADRDDGDEALTLVADIVRIALGASAVAFFAAGDHSAALKALLLLGPALAGRLARAAPAFDLLFALALAAEAILGGLDRIAWGDTESHLVIPFLSAPIVYQVLVRLSAIPPLDLARVPHPFIGAGLVTGIGVLALGAVWELVEWGADGAFGTDYSQGYTDTLTDLLADAIAAVAGGMLVAMWLRATGTSARRYDAPWRVLEQREYIAESQRRRA